MTPTTEAGAEMVFYLHGLLMAFIDPTDPRMAKIRESSIERILAIEAEATTTLRAALDDEKERNGLYLATLDAMNVKIATLRAALDGLAEAADDVLDRWSKHPGSMRTTMDRLRAALATAKEAGG
jgi:vacuolar-type H+-ATPase subunit I/STV1